MREGLLGWSTNALVQLDDEVPGVLARVLTAAAPRKQAIFAALAAREEKVGVFEGADDLFERSFAEVLRHGRANDILRRAFGMVPDGLSGLLEQIGERPLPRSKDYIALHDLLVDDDVRGADALLGSGRITCRKLEVLHALDPRWRHANTLERLDTGTKVLLDSAPEPPAGGDFLDLGCGWGPISLKLATLSPRARVWAVDVNERALDLVRRNAGSLSARHHTR